ncbi:adhesin [Fusobacterium necrophorum subsp. funduliforme]|uniref:Adhesin n=1 Tax=Fusobacterium necrophorum subsp. funduliforme TaxID=143387 RepID=A0A161PQV7_9FUSO|nr:bifunctional oligoribonuclease/PAP phosphatase NrnA [Fusobacterium necrophorum]AYV92352.1 bifunctional oligoribonuclease/PAP phosphatase NrnA [Fusobacterium necrophorum subsp. funduliforme]KYL03598.1 adhesin [Fusobacterium necrophorum subsp. funduliforme]KYM43190.1 adhesin [Fusobacterium necrophorum subsp. funduliforme]KYM59534.1 adhesin [Fusobacterium necrophorum subsp. funduliforme]KYM65130.1 adhesin [Fusobacterium necrophorum subsp. funduliforme]
MKNKTRELLLQHNSILITAHKNPDGDAVGAGLALTLSLLELGKKARFVLQDKVPDTTLFLEGSQLIEQYQAEESFEEVELVIFVDCATRDRAGCMDALTKGKLTVNLDHHMSNPHYGDYAFVEPKISATSELLTQLLQDWNFPMNAAIASALYLGIVNDTGNFAHDNVTVNTLKAAQFLVEQGADNALIVRNFLKTHSYASLKLLGEALSQFQFFPEKKLSYFYLTQEVMNKYGAKKEHTEGIVETLLSYEKASISLFLREEKDGSIKGSMRSKDSIDVNRIASLFGGGGHIKAAGFSCLEKADSILHKILEQI